MESYVNDEELFWEVYIGYNSVPYPTYSMSISHEMIQLKPRTETFVVFSIEHNTILSKHGIFQSKQYCDEGASNADSVMCYKKCLLDKNDPKEVYFKLLSSGF